MILERGESNRWLSSQRMRRESIANNTIEAQALPFVINEISELNTKKTTVPASEEKWMSKKKGKSNLKTRLMIAISRFIFDRVPPFFAKVNKLWLSALFSSRKKSRSVVKFYQLVFRQKL